MNSETTRNKLVNGPLRDLENLCDMAIEDGEAGDLMEIGRGLSSECVHLARVETYVDTRAAGGSHALAVKRSNAVVAKVRKALGFTIGPDSINF